MATMQQHEQQDKRTRSGEQQRGQGEQGAEGAQGGQAEQQHSASTGMTRGSGGAQGSTGLSTQRQREGYLPSPFLDPFNFMRRFIGDMDRIFDDFGLGSSSYSQGAEGSSALRRGQRSWAPPIEIFERGEKLVVRADLPGLRREDLRVDVEGDTLMITGDRRDEREDKGEGYYVCERSYGSFRRAIQLPQDVDPNDVDATYENGVLEIEMKAPKARARTIEVRQRAGQHSSGSSASGSSSASGAGSSGSVSGNGGGGAAGKA